MPVGPSGNIVTVLSTTTELTNAQIKELPTTAVQILSGSNATNSLKVTVLYTIIDI